MKTKLPDKSIINFMKDSRGSWLDVGPKGQGLQPSFVKLSDDDAWKFYRGNDWIFATVNRIVNDCVKAEPQVTPIDISKNPSGRMKERIKIVKDFLRDPNRNKESFMEIRQKIIKDILIYGRACLEKVNSDSNELQEIYAQNPKFIKVMSDEYGNINFDRAYVLQAQRKDKTYFSIDEMIFMVLNPISGSHYGVKTMDAIANTVAADILRATFNSQYFVNNAETSGVLSLQEMGAKDLEKFKKMWREEFKGAKNAHKIAVVNVPINWVRMAVTNRDMEFSAYGKELREKIFSAFNVPPFIMGIVETAGKLNSEAQIDLYKDGELRPILMKEEFHYTHEICYRGFGFNDIKITFPAINLTDIASQSESDRKDIESGIQTINEVRTRRGMPKVPWGDTPINILPGGGQVDPSGRMRPPRGQTKPQKFLSAVRNRLSALIDGLVEESKNLSFNKEFKEICKERKVRINGELFITKFYSLPVEIQRSELCSILKEILDYSPFINKSDDLAFYMDCVVSKIEYTIIKHLLSKKYELIIPEIDKVLSEEGKILSERIEDDR
jgi:HK97 family phage portal protein